MKKIILFVILQQYADWEAAYISSAITMRCGILSSKIITA